MKFRIFIAVLLMSFLSVGCKPDIDGDGPDGNDDNTGPRAVLLTATLEDAYDADTNTALPDREFHWSPQDSVSLFAGPGESGGSLFVSTNTGYVKQATFSGTIQPVTDTAQYRGVFPYDPSSSCIVNGAALMTTVSSSQETGHNSVGKLQNISIGSSTSITKMTFRNLCGGFSFCVSQPGIERVVLRRGDGSPVAGHVMVTEYGIGGTPVIVQMQEAEKSITVTAPGGFTPTGGGDTTWFYVVVPPTDTEVQYTFTLYKGDGRYANYGLPYEYQVKRNTFKRIRPAIDEGLEFGSDDPVPFADAGFQSYCVESFDADGDGKVSMSEADAVTNIEVITDNIASLSGIGYFRNLKELRATGSTLNAGRLKTLDVSGNTKLELLDCRRNQLTSLDVSGNPALTTLFCSENGMATLCLTAGLNIMNLLKDESSRIVYNGATPAAFPDENFRSYVFDSFDTDGDGSLSREECDAVTKIDVCTDEITSLRGVECFTNLESLSCRGSSNNGGISGQLASLDVSENTRLTTLDCSRNVLESLDVSGCTGLTRLTCDDTGLGAIDLSHNSSLAVFISHRSDNLKSIDLSGHTSLTWVEIEKNADKAKVALSGCTSLKYLGLWGSIDMNLSDLSKCTSLEELSVWGCITSSTIDLSPNTALQRLTINGCENLTSLNISKNTALTYLYCAYNPKLAELDVSHNTALKTLWCSDCKLTALDVSNNPSLTNLDCTGNPMTVLHMMRGQTITNLSKEESTRIVFDGVFPTDFPDKNFRAYVFENFDSDGDGKVSMSEADAVTTIKVFTDSITSLAGIGHFRNLIELRATGSSPGTGKLKTLDVSKNTALTYLYCNSNQLTSLDVSTNTALYDLRCHSNQLISLDVSKNTALKTLYCYSNELTSLDVSNDTALTYLYCDSNQLTSLDVSKNISLTYLNCGSNKLTSLDVSKNTALTYLLCPSNQLTSLDVDKNTALTSLNCNSNQLTSLDVSTNTSLTLLYCSFNQLTSLDVSNNIAITRLECQSNPFLTEIWIKLGQSLATLIYDAQIAKIYYKDDTIIPVNQIWYNTDNDLVFHPSTMCKFYNAKGEELTFTQTWDGEKWIMQFSDTISYWKGSWLYVLNSESRLVSLGVPSSIDPVKMEGEDLGIPFYQKSFRGDYVSTIEEFYGQYGGIADHGHLFLVGENYRMLIGTASAYTGTLTVPEGTTSINAYAFVGCKAKSIVLPSTTKIVDEWAFENCNDLTDLYCYAKDCPIIDHNIWQYVNGPSGTLHYPSGSNYSAFYIPSNWTKVADIN